MMDIKSQHNLTEADVELLAQKLIDGNQSRKNERINKIKNKLNNAKDYAFESQEGSIIYIVKWTVNFVVDIVKGLQEAFRARRAERSGNED